jgi:hypothetical protein
MILFVSESYIGSHFNIPSELRGKISFVSLQGNRGIYFDGKAFRLSKGLQNLLSSATKVIIATDLDVEGTKSATVIKNFCDRKGIKAYRIALTEKGYVRTGEVFTERQMRTLITLAKKNKYFYERYGYGFKTITLLGRSYKDFKDGVRKIKVLNKKGTSTITAMVKYGLKGMSPVSGYKTLVQLYKQGILEYPRVDNDYITEKPFTLYPHPPLYPNGKPEQRSKVFFLSPFKEDYIPLRKKTYLLRLSNLRLITPATAVRYYQKIDSFFDEDMTPYREKIKLLELFIKLLQQNERLLRRTLEIIYSPQRQWSEPMPLNELLPELKNVEIKESYRRELDM